MIVYQQILFTFKQEDRQSTQKAVKPIITKDININTPQLIVNNTLDSSPKYKGLLLYISRCLKDIWQCCLIKKSDNKYIFNLPSETFIFISKKVKMIIYFLQTNRTALFGKKDILGDVYSFSLFFQIHQKWSWRSSSRRKQTELLCFFIPTESQFIHISFLHSNIQTLFQLLEYNISELLSKLSSDIQNILEKQPFSSILTSNSSNIICRSLITLLFDHINENQDCKESFKIVVIPHLTNYLKENCPVYFTPAEISFIEAKKTFKKCPHYKGLDYIKQFKV